MTLTIVVEEPSLEMLPVVDFPGENGRSTSYCDNCGGLDVPTVRLGERDELSVCSDCITLAVIALGKKGGWLDAKA